MLLQRLNKNDLPEIIAFNRRCFSPADRWSEADWAELLEDERALYYALLENGQIVGSIFLYDWQGERDFLKIMNLGVAPDRRGQGLACRLLQKAAEELKASTQARCCGSASRAASCFSVLARTAATPTQRMTLRLLMRTIIPL